MMYKLSTEIKLSFDNNKFEFRLRPVDYTRSHKQGVARLDIAAGYSIWKFMIFSYTKFDVEKRYWTGAKLDFNLDFFQKRLLINIQERYFWGLNKNSSDHYYLIQSIRWKCNDWFYVGFFGYGKWKIENTFKKGVWFVGPSFQIQLPVGFSIKTSITENLLAEKNYMFYLQLNYKVSK